MNTTSKIKLDEIPMIKGLAMSCHPNEGFANLRDTNLRDADLRLANLYGSDLSGADLRDVNLRDADLRWADLRDADLRWANLRDVNLRGANLRDANLRDANLRLANLYGADLSGANLRDSDLSGADLSGADLSGADLRDANLRDANLSGADLRWAKIDYPMVCPEKGSFIGFKRTKGYIVELEICSDAKRSSSTTRKCRCSKAKVISITNSDGSNANVDKVFSCWDENFSYEVGKIVCVDDFDEHRWNECTTGIHFFMTRQEAMDYKF